MGPEGQANDGPPGGETAATRGEGTDPGEPEGPRMIVGLGNPGRRYEGTRHNLGYGAVSRLLRVARGRREATRYRSKIWEADLEDRDVVFLLPLTYMNLSGGAVREASEGYEIPPSRVLVVCDDLSLPLGKIRLRRGGSSGGHKGLQSVVDCLGTESFPRLRIGIGDPGVRDAEEYVLSPFEPEEEEAVSESLDRAARAAEVWVRLGIEEAMSRFNG